MEFEYIENVANANLSEEAKKKIDSLMEKYLSESTKEVIAKNVNSIFQDARRSYACRKNVTSNPEKLWDELSRFWFEMNLCYPDLRGRMDFDDLATKISKYYVERLLNSSGQDYLSISRIASDISLGGIPEIIDIIYTKMQNNAVETYLDGLIYKHFKEYKHDFYAVQYIALKYLKKNKPEVEQTYGKSIYLFCYESVSALTGLNNLLKLHIKE